MTAGLKKKAAADWRHSFSHKQSIRTKEKNDENEAENEGMKAFILP